MAEQRFGGDLRVYGKAIVETQGTEPTAVVARALLATQIIEAEKRANHTGTQTFDTISDGKTYVDGRIEALIGGAPAALDTLKEITDQLALDETAASALTNITSDLRTDVDAAKSRLDADDLLLSGLRTDVTANTGLITGLRSDLTTAQGNVSANTSAVTALRADLTVAQSNITSLRMDVDTLSGGGGASTSALRSDLDALTARVSAAETKLNAAGSDLADLKLALAASIYKVTVGDGSTSLLQVMHNLNSTDVEVFVRDLTDGQRTFPVDIVTGANTLSLDFGSYVPTANSIRVIVKAL